MGFHTFDADRADNLEDPGRYRYCSREELLSLLDVHERMVVADLGSGTGFYADDVAPYVDYLYAVDVQDEMHGYYRDKGLPSNVEQVTADVASLPLDDGQLDAAYSTMTYHEFAGDEAFDELHRVLRPGARLVTVDWARSGAGERGPPVEERHCLGDVVTSLADHGFSITSASSRHETFVCVARRD